MVTPEHLDYADEAESAERAEAWPQAMVLWQPAFATCPVEQPTYAEGVARCQRQINVDAQRASIARRSCGSRHWTFGIQIASTSTRTRPGNS